VAELKTEGFDALLNKLGVVLPKLVIRMAFNIDANIASEGRIKEQREANKLEMGKPQYKGKRGDRRRKFKIRSKWDSNVGWVSTSRSAGKGGTGFRMASFSWERVRKNRVTAPYTSQLANLWANQTKPYTSQSPVVGQEGGLTVWRTGEQRPSRYNWSTVFKALADTQQSAIAKTEAKFASLLKEI